MVGRIELVTPKQRNLLREISRFSTNEIAQEAAEFGSNFLSHAISKSANGPLDFERVADGQQPLAGFVSIPKTYQTYLDLGRFRNALLLDEARSHPTEGLVHFITTYRLQAYEPVATQAHL
jgi:hypothetical protein